MPRPATGSIRERTSKSGGDVTFEARFAAYGKRQSVSLGKKSQGWTRAKAEEHLRHLIADAERGEWQPHEPEPVEAPTEVPDFHTFASEWLAARKPELRPRTVEDYTWSLSVHLLPYFKDYKLDEIDAALVDRYKARKVAEGKIAPAQINKTLKRLAQILEQAVDYEYLTHNPAASKGGRRRVKEPKPLRTWVEPDQLLTLLDAAPKGHKALLGTLAGAGLRVGEACQLNWSDLDLSTSTLRVRKAKTSAGQGREVDLPKGLVNELYNLALTSPRTKPDDPVFVGSQGTRQTPSNVGRRLKTAIKHANPKLEEKGIESISDRVSPHSLRRTFASLRFAIGLDPVRVAEEGGWEDPTFPMRVYAKAVRRRKKLEQSEAEAHLEAFDAALEWAGAGLNRDERGREAKSPPAADPSDKVRTQETAS